MICKEWSDSTNINQYKQQQWPFILQAKWMTSLHTKPKTPFQVTFSRRKWIMANWLRLTEGRNISNNFPSSYLVSTYSSLSCRRKTAWGRLNNLVLMDNFVHGSDHLSALVARFLRVIYVSFRACKHVVLDFALLKLDFFQVIRSLLHQPPIPPNSHDFTPITSLTRSSL